MARLEITTHNKIYRDLYGEIILDDGTKSFFAEYVPDGAKSMITAAQLETWQAIASGDFKITVRDDGTPDIILY